MSRPKHIPDPIQLPMFEPVLIPLTQGQYAKIDAVDADLAKDKWLAVRDKNRYYAKRCLYHGGPFIHMHRLILERILERPLRHNEYVDHVDGDGLNNCRTNLRLATMTENNQNCCRHRDNISGFKGVSYYRSRRRYRASIRVNGKTVHLGMFSTAEEAYAAYCEAAKRYFGEFARLE